MPRFLICDGQSVYRIGLRNLIEAAMPLAEVVEARDPREALVEIRASTFDLVLVGTDRSGPEQFGSFKAAREASPSTRFTIVSASDTRADILATLAAGFHGFISKCQTDTEIIAAVTSILAGTIYIPASFAKIDGSNAIGGQSDRGVLPVLSTEDDVLKLTKRQREVLTLLARGLSNKEIARTLAIAEATTKIHLAALLRALGVRNRTEAAYKAANLIDLTGLKPVSVPTRGQNVETSAVSPGLRKKLRRDSSVDLRKVGVQ
jgi:DNA-binding NarL/FixJ family response regulator